MSFPKMADPARVYKTKAQLMAEGMTEQEAQQEVNAQIGRKYGGGMSEAELADFEALVGRLESSKMRQAAQTNQARQRDIYGGGLASIMGNF